MGAVLVLGGAAGLSAAIAPLGLSIAGFSLSTGAAFGISIAIGAGAGIISYAFENGLRTDRTFTLGGMFVSGLSGILKAVTTFGVAYGGGKAGAFDKLLLKPLMEGVKDSVTYGILKGVLNSILSGVGRDLIATSTWFLGESITKIIFVSSVASGLRWLIDKIFGT